MWAQVANIPRPSIAAIVAGICLVGAYASENSMFPVLVMTVFGVIGYVLRKVGIPLAPLLLALVLGEMIESNFRRALVISKGSYDIFLTHPVTVMLLLVAVLSFALPLIATLRGKRRPVLVEEE
jgi:putative tricarboxylic transport membrane protein